MSQITLLDEAGTIELIKTGRPIEIAFPVMNSSVQDAIHFLVSEILKHYDRLDMQEAIYTSLKELIINGIKANIKHAVFVENNINTSDEASLKKGLEILKRIMNEKNLHELEKKAIEKNLTIKLTILHSQDRMIVLVENNTPMSELEEKRIRKSFEAALKYDSIADYYMNNMDDSEGQGIGITMIVLMLKGNQIDPHAFTIDKKVKNTTKAKLDIPIKVPPTLERDF